MQEQLEKNAVTMSEAERRNREREFNDQNRDFQRKQREFREDLNQRRNEELSQVLERANRVIRQIAEQEKFDIIFQEAVYASPRIDITDKVIKALDDKPAGRQVGPCRPRTASREIVARLGGELIGDGDAPDPPGGDASTPPGPARSPSSSRRATIARSSRPRAPAP